MRSSFSYAGYSSYYFGIFIERPPSIESAVRDVQKIEIPGSNTPFLKDNGTYGLINRSYDIALSPKFASILAPGGNSVEANVRNFLSFLQKLSNTYSSLSDSYLSSASDQYALSFMARYAGGADVSNELLKFGRATINFECLPKTFVKKKGYDNDENYVTISDITTTEKTARIYRPNPFILTPSESYPLIRVTFESNALLTLDVGGVPIVCELKRHDEEYQEYLHIDCETKNAWYETANGMINANEDITVGEFPYFYDQDSYLIRASKGASGVVGSVYVEGRWFFVS